MASLDPTATPGYPGEGKADSDEQRARLEPTLSDRQECLFANGRSEKGDGKSVLVVLQGLDTAGKGGVIRHAIGMVDPQGVHIHGFKAPTPEERAHDFLWRIRNALPPAGMIGIFDRSHYEDVLVVRVEQLVPEKEWEARYDLINEFEAELSAHGMRILKCFLNVSKQRQKERLAERLDDPTKYWKFNPSDLETRGKWDQYQEAYAAALERCNTDTAPWYHVPADHKWYRNWAVAQLLTEKLQEMDLSWPPADFNVAEQKDQLQHA